MALVLAAVALLLAAGLAEAAPPAEGCVTPATPRAPTLTESSDRIDLDWIVPQAAGATYDVYRSSSACPQTERLEYDDGEADNGYGPASTTTRYDVVMSFDLPAAGFQADAFEACFSRLGADDAIGFDISFWRADGAAGAPGTLIASVPALATGVSTDLAGSYYTYDLEAQGIVLPDATVYAGVSWDASLEQDFFACSDHDRAVAQPAYSRVDGGAWSSPPAGDSSYTAMIFRLAASDDALVATGLATSSFSDTTVEPGSTYSYTVTAIGAGGCESARSICVDNSTTAQLPQAVERGRATKPPEGSARH